MKITRAWLMELNACNGGMEWFDDQKITEINAVDLVKKLFQAEKYSYVNWLLGRVLTEAQFRRYFAFMLQVYLKLFQNKYPKAETFPAYINAVIVYVKEPTQENKDRAYLADRAYLVYRAYLVDRADRADLVDRADRAYRAYLAD